MTSFEIDLWHGETMWPVTIWQLEWPRLQKLYTTDSRMSEKGHIEVFLKENGRN